MVDDGDVLLQYFKVRRILNMISGICFLVYILVFPALYFSLSGANANEDFSYILYIPLTVCLVIQIACASMILHYRRKALNQIATNGVNYTHAIAQAPPGMAIPYQHPHPQGVQPQAVYILPSGSFQQFYSDQNNVASFPVAVQQQQHAHQPTYNQVVVTTEHQKGAAPNAGWVIPAGETSSVGHSGHSRNDSS